MAYVQIISESTRTALFRSGRNAPPKRSAAIGSAYKKHSSRQRRLRGVPGGWGGGGEEVDGGRRAKEEARQRKEKKKKVREGTAEFVG